MQHVAKATQLHARGLRNGQDVGMWSELAGDSHGGTARLTQRPIKFADVSSFKRSMMVVRVW